MKIGTSSAANLHAIDPLRKPMSTLSATEIALGRSRTYALLSRLYRRALDEETIGYVRAIPALADALPTTEHPDEMAASFQTLFGYNVFPHQTLFLDPAGQLGGSEQTRVRRSLAQTGYRPDPENADDSMAEELAFLAFLCGAEADARRDQLEAIASDLCSRQAMFLTEHLLRWIGPFSVAVFRSGTPFYRALSELGLAFVADHASALGLTASEWTLPQVELSLDDTATDLRTIAGYLLQTPYSGIYLSRDDLTRLGRKLDLPRGFGDREQLLMNLLRAAAAYDAFSALLEQLANEATTFADLYTEMQTKHAVLTPWLRSWHKQATRTAELLRTGAAMTTIDPNDLAAN